MNFFLGVEVSQTAAGIHLCRQRYISDILKRANMSLAKPITSPMSSSATFSKFDGVKFDDATLYRSVVGALQYLSITRPNIAFTVNKVSQFMNEPQDTHWSAIKRILCYLKHTIDHGLFIKKCSSNQLFAFSDADWAGCPDDIRSTSGFCIFLGSNLLSWSSKKQPIVSRSTTESEYKSMANTAADLCWLQSLFSELGVFLPTAPILFCDNISATYFGKSSFSC